MRTENISQERKQLSACKIRAKFPWLFGANAHPTEDTSDGQLDSSIEIAQPPTTGLIQNANISEHLLRRLNSSKTVYYLAYGSNLSAETFLGRRGIHPISKMNVVVPSLRLTFDLPGVPYSEPCFANTARRGDLDERPAIPTISEKRRSLPATDTPRYHKNAWMKGLVGVVYELTVKDFIHVIATEGGGASYKDIIVPCYPLSNDPDIEVPMHPSVPSIDAHTLFAPARPPPAQEPQIGDESIEMAGRFARSDPSYAQPSARYLKLITDGAREHRLPAEYREYLAQIRPYTMTTQRQRLGQFIFLGVWGPIMVFVFALQRLFQNEKGISPPWLAALMSGIFGAVWVTYDAFFSKLFGNGERTLGQ